MDDGKGTPRRALRVVASVAAALIGLGTILIAVTIGDCAAFGGRCPDEPPPLLDDDVFGMAVFGAFLATAIPLALLGRPRRRAARAIVIGGAAALLVGLIARSAAGA